MAGIAVIGMQWGDEGKGKIVDLLTEYVDIVARFQGGNNAGHTVVLGEEKIILHSIPAGILRKGKKCVIGNGAVIDPASLIEEMEMLKTRGSPVKDNLFISNRAHLIMPYHRLQDTYAEKEKKEGRLGTTRRGIGPAYEDKMARRGIRVEDLYDKSVFKKKLEYNIGIKRRLMADVIESFTVEEILSQYTHHATYLKPYVMDTTYLLNDEIAKGRNILFEGAQGTLLDIDHGTYPYVTSSPSSVLGVCSGTGINPHNIHLTIGVLKAYITRVGEGPFPTELTDEKGKLLQNMGAEFGATTGRPRRCGWFDAVAAKYSIMINGVDTIALTKLDVLDRCETIKICTAYKLKDGTTTEQFRPNAENLYHAKPVYEELEGWMMSTDGIISWDGLPHRAKTYVERIENLLRTNISIISSGSARRKTIFRKPEVLKKWLKDMR